MKGNATRVVQVGAGLLALVTLGWVLTGQAAPPASDGVPTDWSHRHVVFSRPATAEQARRLEQDPRYWQQVYRQYAQRTVVDAEPMSDAESARPLSLLRRPLVAKAMQRDWSQDLGTNATVGANNFPAKYSFHVQTVKCFNPGADYVVFSSGLSGSGAQASVIAYYDLWTNCGGGGNPKVNWSYNTGGQVLTSPVISQDGSQIAFVQTSASTATLVLLRWKASTTQTISTPASPTSVAAGSYVGCTTPCMTTLALRDRSNVQTDDTTSSVYYDYSGDTAWVGDNRGLLHKFHPVFSGTPAEIKTSAWPVQLNPGNPTALSGPVHDLASGAVFVGDAGGFFYRVSASSAAIVASAQIDHGAGIVAGPILDATLGRVYVFASSDGTTNCTAATPCAAVHQFLTNFASGATGTSVVVGSAGVAITPNPLYDGAFDSSYFSSVNSTGNLYVCGNTGGPPTIYRIPVTAGVMGTPIAGPVLASATTGCSPVTDVANSRAAGGNAEWFYASVQGSGTGNSCAAGGCVSNYKDLPWTALTTFVKNQEIVDTHFQVQAAVTTSATTGASTPAWSTTVGATTVDGGMTWINQGVHAASHPAWAALTAYSVGTIILDSNNNVELVTRAGTSGFPTHPGWNSSPNGNTAEGPSIPQLLWRNLGPVATVSLPAASGTSGLIMDSTVVGASDVYFLTQGNQVCGTSGTGGCAVQASQSGLN